MILAAAVAWISLCPVGRDALTANSSPLYQPGKKKESGRWPIVAENGWTRMVARVAPESPGPAHPLTNNPEETRGFCWAIVEGQPAGLQAMDRVPPEGPVSNCALNGNGLRKQMGRRSRVAAVHGQGLHSTSKPVRAGCGHRLTT